MSNIKTNTEYSDYRDLYKIEAKINGERIECGKCGSLLERIVKISKPIEGNAILLSKPDKNGNAIGWYSGGNVELEIKCKHKSQGKCCDTINIISL